MFKEKPCHEVSWGYHGAKPRRFEELFEAYSAQQNTGILDFLNVKYILYPEEESGELKPLLNPNALGPVWMVSEIETKAHTKKYQWVFDLD